MKIQLFLLFIISSLGVSAQQNCYNFYNPFSIGGEEYNLPPGASFLSKTRGSATVCQMQYSNSFSTDINTSNHIAHASLNGSLANKYLLLNDDNGYLNPSSSEGDNAIILRTRFNDISNAVISMRAFLEMQNLHLGHNHSDEKTAPFFQVRVVDAGNGAEYFMECIDHSDLTLVNSADSVFSTVYFKTFDFYIPPVANGRDIYFDFIASDCRWEIGKDFARAAIESICIENCEDSNDFNQNNNLTFNTVPDPGGCDNEPSSCDYDCDCLHMNAYLSNMFGQNLNNNCIYCWEWPDQINKPIFLNGSHSYGEDGYFIGILADYGTHTAWNGKWFNGEMGVVDLLNEVWRTNHPNWDFWPGEYTVRVAFRKNGCTSWAEETTLEFTVRRGCRKRPQITANNTNSDSTPYRILSSSKNEFDVKLFPNPSNTHINIEGEFENKTTLEVIDFTGKIIDLFTVKASSNFKVDLSNYPVGYYWVRATQGKTSKTQKFAVVR